MMSRLRTLAMATAMFVFAAGGAAAQTATIQVIHNSPSPAAASVDVYLNGAGPAAIAGLGFRQATGLVDLPAGSYTVGIAPAGSSGPGEVIATFGPYDLAAGSQTVIMAAGELGADFGLFAALNDGTVLALPANSTVPAEDASWSGFKATFR